jgi:putative folate metabolism gamma-glutamate ligase
MQITTYKTHKVKQGDNLHTLLDIYLPRLEEKSIVLITSKIISICEGKILANDGKINKEDLIKKEADFYYIDNNLTQYGLVIPTIKNSILIANAGVDESNADGNFILCPENSEQTADEVWRYLKNKHNLNELGVIITDSHLVPLRWGTHGFGIAWCGFEALQDYRGKPDIFGRHLHMSQKNTIDGLASAAVVIMGEGNEQTPLAVITDVAFVSFQNRTPTQEERKNMTIAKEDDLYGKMLNALEWKKGEGKK